jgi:MinD superfamily P-loop ATPase
MAAAKHFGVPTLVVINKVDINPSVAAALEEICAAQGVDVIGRIPYDSVVTEAMVHGLPVTSYTNSHLVSRLQAIWGKTKDRLFADEAISV